ncbi:unnamed protein product [Dimorphilus gyrociliatus]|nr:unnamed protein product [Dimorphilus gyrociliatus]
MEKRDFVSKRRKSMGTVSIIDEGKLVSHNMSPGKSKCDGALQTIIERQAQRIVSVLPYETRSTEFFKNEILPNLGICLSKNPKSSKKRHNLQTINEESGNNKEKSITLPPKNTILPPIKTSKTSPTDQENKESAEETANIEETSSILKEQNSIETKQQQVKSKKGDLSLKVNFARRHGTVKNEYIEEDTYVTVPPTAYWEETNRSREIVMKSSVNNRLNIAKEKCLKNISEGDLPLMLALDQAEVNALEEKQKKIILQKRLLDSRSRYKQCQVSVKDWMRKWDTDQRKAEVLKSLKEKEEKTRKEEELKKKNKKRGLR